MIVLRCIYNVCIIVACVVFLSLCSLLHQTPPASPISRRHAFRGSQDFDQVTTIYTCRHHSSPLTPVESINTHQIPYQYSWGW